MSMKRIVIVGGGPAGLMAATQLLDSKCEIILIDQKGTIGRKFLVAGDGGFNLTHSEEQTSFLEKYDCDWIKNAVEKFSATDFRDFLDSIGVPTIIGSSGKVFPTEDLKPIDVLNSWKKLLSEKVEFRTTAKLVDFSDNALVLDEDGKNQELSFDYLVLALGGGSWSITGSDGKWLELFEKKNIAVSSFRSSNSGIVLYENWLCDLEGKIVKNVVVSCNDLSCAGDLVCTSYGLEGKPVYAMNRALREQEKPQITIDFKPQVSLEKVSEILRKAKNTTQGLKELKLGDAAMFWIKNFVSKEKFINPKELAKLIKQFPIGIKGFRPLDEVISTAGGVETSELEETGALKQFPNVFCAGEMINWDAPTGGYLIQGCVSSGYVAGNAITGLVEIKPQSNF